MSAATRSYYLHKSRKLLDVLAKFGITTPTDSALKDRMRDLILSTDVYTEAEWAAIVSYCWEDILVPARAVAWHRGRPCQLF